ncbi:class I SAM-dependent methyltransferase [Natrononativus amylolyticus]|uniref:class I SAM-dependent methyltransferase n=1 Tax=Natrononativus amylolyticus TaxID=2963434 RepID=UPI0020CD8A11|nr:class I SAM-dependent methyltransferase [Natrononativus amylolyticus]
MTVDSSPTLDVSEYYSSDEVVAEYSSAAENGLSDIERTVIDTYFTDEDATVLDLGCGAGRTTTVLSQRGFDVIGLDLVRSLVDRAKTTSSGIEFVTGNACSLPFESESFEYVLFSWNGIDHINPEELRYWALQEVHRVLKPDGVFAFSTHNFWSAFVIRSFDVKGVQRFVEFWVQNLRRGQIISKYKISNNFSIDSVKIYYIRPRAQKQQLRNCGFDPLRIVRPGGPLQRWFDHPYYVARKIDRCDIGA